MISTEADTSQFATILDVLKKQAGELAEKVAYDFNGEEQTTFVGIYHDALDLARGLAVKGLGRADFCAIITPMNLDQIRLVFAVQLTGAAPVLFDPAAPSKLLRRRLAQIRTRMAVVGSEQIAPLKDELASHGESIDCFTISEIERRPEAAGPALPAVHPADTAYLQFTSGTTGDPKAAVITHQNLAEYLRIHAGHVGYFENDIFLSWTPLFHDLGLVGYVFLSLFVGVPSYLLPPNMKSLGVWLQTASSVGATVTSSPDFAYRIVTRSVRPEGLDLTHLRMTGSGGEPLRMETIRKFEERFGLRSTSVGGYGQAESVMCISMGIPGRPLRVDEAGNVDNGHPLSGLEVRIVDEAGHALPANEPGEITMRGPTIFAGYLNDEDATAHAIRDGWLYTGDTGYLDEDGYLFVQGRKKLLIKRGGSVIAPREVEVAADQVEGVRFSVAVGMARESSISSEDLIVLAEVKPDFVNSPDKRFALSESIVAAVAAATGHAPSEVLLLKPRSMPRTANGKVQHGRIRELVARKGPELESLYVN